MNVIIQKIQEIRLNPIIYLAKPTLILLKTFIDGYAMRERELNGDVNCEILEGFQRYVMEKYQENLALNWADIINRHSKSEEEAFSMFFNILDEYVNNGCD